MNSMSTLLGTPINHQNLENVISVILIGMSVDARWAVRFSLTTVSTYFYSLVYLK